MGTQAGRKADEPAGAERTFEREGREAIGLDPERLPSQKGRLVLDLEEGEGRARQHASGLVVEVLWLADGTPHAEDEPREGPLPRRCPSLEAREAAREALLGARDEILALADGVDPVIKRLGGGARDLEVRTLPDTAVGPMLVVHLIYDCRDAMGANAVNTACETLAPLIARITGGRIGLRILSNLADRRLARANCSVPADALAFGEFEGAQVVQGIIEAAAFAAADPYRAATHNKGIMNGIDAVALATGQDWRALEAGAHAYAARSGQYASLSKWERGPDGGLRGSIELPLAVGTVGGATRAHPSARLALRLMGVETARELAEAMAAVGLAQNMAALRALATEGIQKGHMALHARQVAIAAGAAGPKVELVANRMVAEGNVRPDRAAEILGSLQIPSGGD